MEINRIGWIRTDFPAKFGIPRQSGLVEDLAGTVVFEAKYRNPDAFRGLEEFSHIWLVWEFSESARDKWQPMVRPPRLGGKHKERGICYTFTFSAKSHRVVLCTSGAD